MIKFFRRIRQRLLSENKFSKYLLYAIGEIILVVIGILIALYINNHNEELKSEAQLQQYIEKLIVSFENDMTKMDNGGNQYAFIAHSGQYLLVQAGLSTFDWEKDGLEVPSYIPTDHIWNNNIPDTLNTDFIPVAFLWTIRLGDLTIATPILEEMKSTGVYSKLPNDIKNDIEYYSAQWFNNIGPSHQAKIESYVNKWENSLGTLGLFNSSIDELDNPLSILAADKERVFLLKLLIRESGWFSLKAKWHKEQAQLIKSDLEAYLKTF